MLFEHPAPAEIIYPNTISGNADAGVFNRGGTLTLTNSTVSGNTFGGVSSLGGVTYRNTATLTNSTVSGNLGDGVKNDSFSTLTITNSTISGNRRAGVDNRGALFMTNSTISGNSFGGVDNSNTATITNSTISGNSGSSSGGGVNNRSFLTLTDSTVSGNSAEFGGGLFNCGSSKLTESLVSGNTAPRGAEIFDNGAGLAGGPCGRVIADFYNLFGHDGVAGVQGFTPGETDLVGQSPLSAILNPTLADNGGPTKTHALVVASPAVDAVPCVTTTDQRGAPRPQDGDGNAVADCDIGAFELGARPVEAVPAAQNPKVRCTASRCDIRIKCNVAPASGAQCTNRIDIFVSRSAARLSEPASTKAPGQIRFAFGVTNVPPGETRNVRLRPTKRGKKIVRTSPRKSLRGVLEIRNSIGAVSSTRIRIRLR